MNTVINRIRDLKISKNGKRIYNGKYTTWLKLIYSFIQSIKIKLINKRTNTKIMLVYANSFKFL